MGFEGIEEVLGMFLADIFDAKVVDYEGECYWTRFVFEEAVRVGSLVVAMQGKEFDDSVVR